MPYISVYYESINLKGTQIGQLGSIPYFISFVSGFIFAFFSDISKKHKTVLRLCALGTIVTLFIYPHARTFSALIVVVLLRSMINAPFTSILDRTTLDSLQNTENYGKIRAGGSIGWAIMVTITGLIVDRVSMGLKSIFYINIFFLLMFLLVTIRFPDQKRAHIDPENQASLKSLWTMLRSPGFTALLPMLAIWGIGQASIGNFLFLHIKSLGGSSTLMGISLSISVIGEIVTFSIANKLQNKFGPQKMMILSFLVLFTWLFGLSLIRNPYAIPFFQIFGGASFALIQSGSVAYVNARAPKELGTTALSISSGILLGLGGGIGALVSGKVYEIYGSVVLFRNMAFFVSAGFLLGVVLYFKNKRKSQSAAD